MCVSYRLVGAVDASEEQGFGNEQGDAEVLVDGVSVALEAAEKTEGEDADEQADQRQQDPHPCYDVQKELVHLVCLLKETEKETERDDYSVLCCAVGKTNFLRYI